MKLVIRLLSQVKLVWHQFTLGLILLILSSIGVQLGPLIIQHVIDRILTPLTKGVSLNIPDLLMTLGIFIGLTAISSLFGYLSVRLLMHAANLIGAHLRERAYKTMQGLPISYFDDKPAGKIASRIVNDTETLRNQFYGTLLSQLLVNLLWVISIYAVMIYLNPLLGGSMLVLIPIFFVWHKVYANQTEKAMTVFYEAQSEINSQVNEAMNGSSIIQLFGQEQAVADQFEQTAQKMLDADFKMIKVEATISWTLVEFFKLLVISVVIYGIGQQFLGGQLGLSVGTIFAYINYTERLFNTLGMLVRLLPTMQRSLVTGERVFELLDAQTEPDSPDQLTFDKGTVEFKAVNFGYLPKQPILHDISFFANQGETIALVGHTGSGKSSIMNLLFRFYDPQSGDILIDGQNIQNFQRESVRSEMGIVLQDPYLFTGTIASNVAMDDETMPREVIVSALEKVGAKPMIDRLKLGIDEPVVEKGAAFSSGERQLIAFARTLAADPKILILDEATSHIDTETEEIIQRAMAVVKEGRTTLIIAHRLSTIQNADQILVLHEGRIAERGNHQQLLAQNGLYAEMFRMQQRVG